MTELNKRSPELQPVTVPAFVVNEYNQLKLENIALKEQLRWRPVSEKLPSVEKDGDAVIARLKDLDEGLVQFVVVSTVWFVDKYESWYSHWLPIPPAPEGERTREHRAWEMLIRRLNYLNTFGGNRSEMEKTTRIVAEIWDDTGHEEEPVTTLLDGWEEK